MHRTVLTLDQSGRPNHWATWEEAVLLKVKGLVAWHLGEEFEIRGGVSRVTGERTILVVPTIIAVKGQRHARRVPLTNETLFQRDENICCYCGRKFSRKHLTREHVIPVSRGGATSWLNCATCCKDCNNKKQNFLPEEVDMPLLYVPYEPDVSEALLLEGRHIIADQMQFLKACLPKSSKLHNVTA